MYTPVALLWHSIPRLVHCCLIWCVLMDASLWRLDNPCPPVAAPVEGLRILDKAALDCRQCCCSWFSAAPGTRVHPWLIHPMCVRVGLGLDFGCCLWVRVCCCSVVVPGAVGTCTKHTQSQQQQACQSWLLVNLSAAAIVTPT
jgi:hypothetical protein